MAILTKIDKKNMVAVISLDERLDALNIQQLKNEVKSLLPQTSRIIFDCTGLDFIDSSGLGTVVSSLRKTEAAGGGLRLAGIGPKAKMVFEITRADKLFAFNATVDDALASFGQ